MTEIQIRPAKKEDLIDIHSLICDLEADSLNKTEFEKIFEENLNVDHIHYLVAEKDSETAGFISVYIYPLLHHCGKIAEIQEMIVKEPFRRRGIGKKLIEHAKAIAENNSCINVELASNMNRKAAHVFYGKIGFIQSHYKFIMRLTNEYNFKHDISTQGALNT